METLKALDMVVFIFENNKKEHDMHGIIIPDVDFLYGNKTDEKTIKAYITENIGHADFNILNISR